MILSTSLTFLVLLAAAYLITQFAFRAAVPVLYGQEGVQDYLVDYLDISPAGFPLGRPDHLGFRQAFIQLRRSGCHWAVVGICLRHDDLGTLP